MRSPVYGIKGNLYLGIFRIWLLTSLEALEPNSRVVNPRQRLGLGIMAEREPTCIGRVRHVLGATVTVALDPDLAGVAPIYRGRLQSVGQIGSLVRIPQGLVELIATVNLVGIAELAGPLSPADSIQRDDRWLQVQLLGEI